MAAKISVETREKARAVRAVYLQESYLKQGEVKPLKFPLYFQDPEEYAKKNIKEPSDPRPQKQGGGYSQ